MKKLYLVTMGFPYGKGEKTFITPELGVIANCFDVTIISVTSQDIMSDIKNRSELPENVKHNVIVSDINFFTKVKDFLEKNNLIGYGEFLDGPNDLGEDLKNTIYEVKEIRDTDLNILDAARHPKQLIVLNVDFEVSCNDMIRLVINK